MNSQMQMCRKLILKVWINVELHLYSQTLYIYGYLLTVTNSIVKYVSDTAPYNFYISLLKQYIKRYPVFLKEVQYFYITILRLHTS